MPIKRNIIKKSDHEHRIIWKEHEEDLEKEKKEKYKQLEFEFEDYNISDDQVAPI